MTATTTNTTVNLVNVVFYIIQRVDEQSTVDRLSRGSRRAECENQ